METPVFFLFLIGTTRLHIFAIVGAFTRRASRPSHRHTAQMPPLVKRHKQENEVLREHAPQAATGAHGKKKHLEESQNAALRVRVPRGLRGSGRVYISRHSPRLTREGAKVKNVSFFLSSEVSHTNSV